MTESGLTRGRIFRFWAPLAATWLMMAVEGPFITAVIARAGEAAVNLAAFGVAFALAMLLESPVILLLSASTALVHDTASYGRLRNFTWALCGLVTLLWAVVMFPPVFAWVGGSLMGLPPEVAHRANVACAVLLPWPAAIGYRRFYQGLLIRSGRTRMVAYGTVTRLAAMVSTALAVSATGTGRGALLGAMALSAGVVVEAAASRIMARRSLRELTPTPPGEEPVLWGTAGLPMTYAAVTRFYVPLALTSLLQLGVNPLVAAFLGRGRLPLESLAVQPVVNALVFVFRSMGMAFQEVAIALRGERGEGYPALGRFATGLALATAGTLGVMAVTPLAGLWFRDVAGLTPDLVRVALPPVWILVPMPAFSVLMAFQHAALVSAARTRAVSWGTVVEVSGIVLGLVVGIDLLGWVGATAAAAALMAGRVAAAGFLLPRTLAAVREIRGRT